MTIDGPEDEGWNDISSAEFDSNIFNYLTDLIQADISFKDKCPKHGKQYRLSVPASSVSKADI